MHFDFDTVIDRRHTDSEKYDFAAKHGVPEDALPLWVADMDFRAPECVQTALKQVVHHGIYGYSDSNEDYDAAVSGWFLRHFQWDIQPEWIVKTPGVVFALANAVRAFTQSGDAVLIQPPVYFPFYGVVRDNDRVLVENPLIYRDGKYTIDFRDFERKIIEHQVKLFILCSPHNPICRVWTMDELQTLGAICQKHHVIVVSDEIHCDFAFPAHPHTPFLKANPTLWDRCVVCTAPSKTFNLAGLQASNIIIPGETLRSAFRQELRRCGSSGLNQMGLAACRAAYQGGDAWLEACKQYLQENLSFVRDYLHQQIPQIRLVEPEGTYFAWLDCSGLGMTPQDLNHFMLNNAKLWLDDGSIFGACAGQFQRVVLACPRATLRRAMERLKAAVQSIL